MGRKIWRGKVKDSSGKLGQFDLSSPKVKTVSSAVSKALQSTKLPQSWLNPVLEIIARESSFDPQASNPKSSAKGLFQFLDSTRKNYGGSGVDWNDPNVQVKAGIKYIKSRYGTPEKAIEHHNKHGWY